LKRLCGAITCGAILILATGQQPRTATLDECTVIAVQMMDKVDSSDARPGDFFRFETINAVTAGAAVVVPERTMGEGVVAVASPAGAHDARPGTLVLEPRYLILPNGKHLDVVLNHNTTSLIENGASVGIPGYLGAIPIPGVGAAIGVFNYFHKGKNILVPRGTEFTVFPSDDPSVEHCQDHPAY
jgi:hypothetical protein